MPEELLTIMSLCASITSLQYMCADSVIDLASEKIDNCGYPILTSAHYYILGVAYLITGKPQLATRFITCIPDKLYSDKLQQLSQDYDYQSMQLSLHVLDNKLRALSDELVNTKYPKYK